MNSLRTGSPEAAGLCPKGVAAAYRVVEDWTARRQLPGAVVAIGRRGVLLGPQAFGLAQLLPFEKQLEPDSIFDLASLTKVVATTPLALHLIEQGLIRLDDSVAQFVPGVLPQITIRHLLTHTSGLPAWLPLYRTEDPLGALKAQGVICWPGARVMYSCLGFILLGIVLEQVTGKNLSQLAHEVIFSPLGMKDTSFIPSSASLGRVVPTELKENQDKCLWGEVHDENARALGGISGNAGLFGTATDLSIYCQLWLNKGCYGGVRLFSQATVALATSNHTPSKEEERGLGWLLKSPRLSSAGDLFSPSSFGHTGFTGTSIWIDPERDLFLVLLTNRAHPSRCNNAHIRLRPLVANAVAAAVL